MVLVLMFLCDQSYTSHGRDFLLGVTILNSSVIDELLDTKKNTKKGSGSNVAHPDRKPTLGDK